MMNFIFTLCLTFFLCDANIRLDEDNGSVTLRDEVAEIRRDMVEIKRNYDSLKLQSEVRFLRRGMDHPATIQSTPTQFFPFGFFSEFNKLKMLFVT